MSIKKSISSGILKVSARIVEEECWLAGAILTGGSTDSSVIFYDSSNGELGDKLEVGYIDQGVPLINFAAHCTEGLYAEIAEGAEYLVLYFIS